MGPERHGTADDGGTLIVNDRMLIHASPQGFFKETGFCSNQLGIFLDEITSMTGKDDSILVK